MEPKVIICGTGRAGTTLLVRVFTAAGLETGFTRQDGLTSEKNIGRAGLETIPNRNNIQTLPRIIKSPSLVDKLPRILAGQWFPIGLAIIPVRNLQDAADSRKNVHDRAAQAGGKLSRAPGGLWKTHDADQQHWVLSEQFYKTVNLLVDYEVPMLFVSFPRFALDPEYFDKTVSAELSERFNWSRECLNRAYQEECRPDLVTLAGGEKLGT